MATAHLVHGYLGAGKTTLARQIEGETGGIRFSADEWYIRLFVGDQATTHLDDLLWDRLLLTLEQLWVSVVGRGVDVVLDFGFWRRAARDQARTLASAVGADVVLYQVVCEDAVARQRCIDRNAAPAGSFVIDPTAFDDLKAKFEPIGPDEPAVAIDTTSRSGHSGEHPANGSREDAM
jgi:predicted kinase